MSLGLMVKVMLDISMFLHACESWTLTAATEKGVRHAPLNAT